MKILEPLLALLRTWGMQVTENLLKDSSSFQMLQAFGWVINFKKCALPPSMHLMYLALILGKFLAQVFLLPEKVFTRLTRNNQDSKQVRQ